MARGWESKSVEQQIDSAEADQLGAPKGLLTPAEIQLHRKRQNLLLARSSVLQQLQSAQNPRYQELLKGTLADLEAKLAELGGGNDWQGSQ